MSYVDKGTYPGFVIMGGLAVQDGSTHSLDEVRAAVREWCSSRAPEEIVFFTYAQANPLDEGDYTEDGFLLRGGVKPDRGTVTQATFVSALESLVDLLGHRLGQRNIHTWDTVRGEQHHYRRPE